MIPNLEMRRGDLKPDLVLDLTDDVLGLVPVTAATSVSIVAQRNGVMLFKRPAVVDADGVVRMEWQVADTSTPGTIVVEAEIIWPGGKPETIRSENVVKILPDLG